MRYLTAALLTLTACSQQVYSPPSQAFSLGPLRSLPQGRRALDVEVSRHAQIFDPAIDAGAARLRWGVGRDTELSAEGTALVVEDNGKSNADRRLFTGRFGGRTTSANGGTALFGGLGGGYAPAGGTFAAADLGVAAGYHNCVLVPLVQASGFLSVPLDARPIDVTDNQYKEFDTPRRTAGGVVRAGLRLSLSPSTCRAGEQPSWLTAGAGITHLADGDSDQTLFGIGLGLEIPL